MNFIAEAFERRLATRPDDAAGRFDELDAKARAVAHPLTAEQTYMVDYQLYTPLSTMYNLFSLFRLEKGLFESDALAAVVTQAIMDTEVVDGADVCIFTLSAAVSIAGRKLPVVGKWIFG